MNNEAIFYRKLKPSNSVKFSHDVSICTFESKIWFCKKMDDLKTVQFEVLAQEFFRLMIPHQPETRVAQAREANIYYILSEEVSGYHLLPEGEPDSFNNGNYTGLGQVCVGSMFLQEIDLKNGNLGLDDKKRVIKIDGDYCFSQLDNEFSNEKYDITPKSIESLPYPQDFYQMRRKTTSFRVWI